MAEYKFVVSHGSLNRLFECRKHELLELAKERFNVEAKTMVLSYYSKDFDLDVAVSSPCEIPDGGKLQLVELLQEEPAKRSLSRITDRGSDVSA